jgi:hypothetical protein
VLPVASVRDLSVWRVDSERPSEDNTDQGSAEATRANERLTQRSLRSDKVAPIMSGATSRGASKNTNAKRGSRVAELLVERGERQGAPLRKL